VAQGCRIIYHRFVGAASPRLGLVWRGTVWFCSGLGTGAATDPLFQTQESTEFRLFLDEPDAGQTPRLRAAKSSLSESPRRTFPFLVGQATAGPIQADHFG
jgi:hypothetical protein